MCVCACVRVRACVCACVCEWKFVMATWMQTSAIQPAGGVSLQDSDLGVSQTDSRGVGRGRWLEEAGG